MYMALQNIDALPHLMPRHKIELFPMVQSPLFRTDRGSIMPSFSFANTVCAGSNAASQGWGGDAICVVEETTTFRAGVISRAPLGPTTSPRRRNMGFPPRSPSLLLCSPSQVLSGAASRIVDSREFPLLGRYHLLFFVSVTPRIPYIRG